MIGIDAINKNRFLINKDKMFEIANKILSINELNEFKLVENKTHYLATRWAIKESLFKCDNKYFQFSKINILKQNGRYMFEDFEISTTSEDNLIIAIVYKK